MTQITEKVEGKDTHNVISFRGSLEVLIKTDEVFRYKTYIISTETIKEMMKDFVFDVKNCRVRKHLINPKNKEKIMSKIIVRPDTTPEVKIPIRVIK